MKLIFKGTCDTQKVHYMINELSHKLSKLYIFVTYNKLINLNKFLGFFNYKLKLFLSFLTFFIYTIKLTYISLFVNKITTQNTLNLNLTFFQKSLNLGNSIHTYCKKLKFSNQNYIST